MLTTRLAAAGGGPTVLVFNTPGTFSWTAPAGVTNVKRLTGRGGSGSVTQTWQPLTSEASRYLVGGIFYDFENLNPQVLLGTSLTFEEVISFANSLLPEWQAITTNPNGAFYPSLSAWYFNYLPAQGRWSRFGGEPPSYPGTYRRTGPVTIEGTLLTRTGTVPNDRNTLVFASASNQIERLNTVTLTGGNSSALGRTFLGTTNNTPIISTFTDIAVTPGTTYSIVVGINRDLPVSFIELEF